MWNDPFFDVLIWFSHEWEKTNMSANNTDTLWMLLRDLFHQLNSVSNIYWQNWMMGTHYLGELFKDRRMRIKKDVYITWQLGFMLIVFPGRDSTTWKTAKDSWMQPFHDLCVETWCSQAFFSFQGFIFPVLATHIYRLFQECSSMRTIVKKVVYYHKVTEYTVVCVYSRNSVVII